MVSDKGKKEKEGTSVPETVYLEKVKNFQGRFCKTHETMAVVKWLQARQRKWMRDGLTLLLQMVKQWDVYCLPQ